jgi:hypothetical protein
MSALNNIFNLWYKKQIDKWQIINENNNILHEGQLSDLYPILQELNSSILNTPNSQ